MEENEAEVRGEEEIHKTLGNRMKEYEQVTSLVLDPTRPFIMRLDGHRFSKFTAKFKKPHDERIKIAMEGTTRDLFVEFGPTAAFTCSDEITLVFPAAVPREGEELSEPKTEEEKKKLERRKGLDPISLLPNAGKIQKLVSLTAGYASTCFNIHLKACTYDPVTEPDLVQHLDKARPYFDSRVFNVPSNAEVFNNVFWRASHDFRRNSIAGLAQAHFPHKALQGLNTAQMLAKLKEEKNIEWDDCPDWYKWGIYVKKESYMLETDTPKGEKVTVKRHRVVSSSFPIPSFDQVHVQYLLCKHLDSTETK